MTPTARVRLFGGRLIRAMTATPRGRSSPMSPRVSPPVAMSAFRPATAPVTNMSASGEGSSPRQTGTTTITVGSSSLIADETQNALIVRAKPAQIRQIESVLADLDARRAQVLRATVTQTLQAELPVIPIAWYRQHVAVNRRLQGVSLDPLERSYRLTDMHWSNNT